MTENFKAFLISLICFIVTSPIAEAKDYPIKLGIYISSNRSIATIVREDGQLLLSVLSRPAQGRGSFVGADCELRAIYNPINKKWELIPFSNETMNVRLEDISQVSFYFTTRKNKFFNIDTDFASTNCANGTIFDRLFRYLRKH